jgi:hypothetical protein
MNHSKTNGTASLALTLLAAAFFVTGCGTTPKPKPWNLSITKTTPASIQVDLIGITESEQPKWEGYSMDQYWSDGDLRRINAKPLTKTLAMNQPWTISETDPKWQEWLDRGATELVIIANLPGKFPPGSADPRLNFFPLDKHIWISKNHTLEFEVQDTQVVSLTPQKPK